MTVLLSGPLATTSFGLKTNCQEPRDLAELAHCFLGQFRCLPSYFGIEGAPDYPKALKCFESNKHWPFVVLMYLNGEGTKRDLEKAQSVLENGKKTDPDEFGPHQAEVLQEAINRCKGIPQGPCPRVDYCKDLSVTTPDLEMCDALDQLSEEAVFSRAIAATGSKLSPADRVLFDQTVTEFKAYQLDDMQRQYQASINASLRDLAGAGQAAFVRENFMKLMAHTIQSRNLKPATIHSYNVLQTKLDRELARELRETTDFWQEEIRNPQMKEWWDEYKSDLEDYKKWLRQSQLQWIKFRDACAELASSLYRGQTKEFDPALSMKTAMTRLRILELRYKPDWSRVQLEGCYRLALGAKPAQVQ
jgi:uncharacterized protein YecT (DUF1311 family)